MRKGGCENQNTGYGDELLEMSEGVYNEPEGGIIKNEQIRNDLGGKLILNCILIQ